MAKKTKRGDKPLDIVAALRLCQEGERVRPICWRTSQPDDWVEVRRWNGQTLFVEMGEFKEIPLQLMLRTAEEFLGPWEVHPLRQPTAA